MRDIFEIEDLEELKLYIPKKPDSILFLLDADKLLDKFLKYLKVGDTMPIIASHIPKDRLSQYTPWPIKAIDPKFRDFGGRADETIKMLDKNCEKLKKKYDLETILLGYSLGGLCSFYASTTCENFDGFYSISGSFWYPNWTKYLKKNPPKRDAKYAMLFGKNEAKPEVKYLKDAYKNSLETYEIMKDHIGEFPVIIDEENHQALELRIKNLVDKIGL